MSVGWPYLFPWVGRFGAVAVGTDPEEFGETVTPTTDTGWATYLAGSGRLFLPAGTNYLLNPRLVEGATSGQWWGEGIAVAPHGTPGYDIVANGDGSFYHEITYEVTAEDLASGGQLLLYCGTDAGNFTNADPVTLAMEYQLLASNVRSLSSGTLGHLDQAYGDYISVAMPAAAVWTRLSVSGACGAATTSRLPWITAFVVNQATGVAGDTITFRMRYPSLVKSATLTPYFDGSYDDCAWTGTTDQSTSTRTASDLEYADYVEITSAGVVAAGTNVAYSRNASGTYYGPIIVVPAARDAGWQAAVAAAWGDLAALWALMVSGDLLIPLVSDATAYLKPYLRLLPGCNVKVSALDSANKVFCVVQGSSPLVAEDATFDTVGQPLRYSVTPREALVLIQDGDATAAQAVADAQLAFRQTKRYYITGLRIPIEYGLLVTRAKLLKIEHEMSGVSAEYPVRKIVHDFKSQETTIEVGDYSINPQDADSLFMQLAKAVSVLKKTAAI